MTDQLSLFAPANLAKTVEMPLAPQLVPHTDWPYPGMTPQSSAQASLARTEAYFEMLAAVINAQGGAGLTTGQVLALVPQDWRELCGKFAHGSISSWAAKKHGIEIEYVSHEGVGGHFKFKAVGDAAQGAEGGAA